MQRDEALRDAKSFEEIIARIDEMLLAKRGENGIRPVVPGEFKGLRVIEALEQYMRARQGSKIPLTRIVEALMLGDVEPGKPRGTRTDPAALISTAIKISLWNNKRLFSWEPEGSLEGRSESQILVSLAATAHQVKRRKKYFKKQNT
jgi:hypothetical protein